MWNDLSMAQKSELMKMFIQNGVYDLNTIIKEYDSRHQSGDEATLPNYSQNVFAEGGNIDDDRDNIDNRTGKPRYRRDIHNVNITSSSENDIEGAARDTNTIGPLAFYPPKYYISRQGNQFAENPNVTYDSWFDEHPEMIDVMTDIVGRYNNRLNNRGQQLPQLNRFYFEKLYNPEDDPIIHEAIERMLQAKWNRDVRTYNDNRTLNLWDTVEKFPAANTNYAKGGHLYQGYSEPTQKMRTLYDEASDQIYGVLPELTVSTKAPKGYTGYPKAFEKEYSDNGGIYGGFRNKDRAYKEWEKTQKYFSPENLDKNRWKGFKPFVPLVTASMAAPAVVAAGAALAPIVAESAPIVSGYATKFGLPLATAITGGKALDDFIARNGDYRGFADWANQTLYRENATPENEEVLEFFNPGYAVAGIPNTALKGIDITSNYIKGVEKRLAETALRQGDGLMRRPLTAIKNTVTNKNAINYILNPNADPKLAYNLGPWFNYNGTAAFSGQMKPMKMNGEIIVDNPVGYEGDVIDLFLGKNLNKAHFPLVTDYPKDIKNYTFSRYGIKSPRVYNLGVVDNKANIGQTESMGIYKNGEPVLDPGGHVTYGKNDIGTLHYDIWKYNPTDFIKRWAAKEDMSKIKKFAAKKAASFIDKQGTPIAHIWTQPWEGAITNDSPVFSLNKKFNWNFTEKDLKNALKDLPSEVHLAQGGQLGHITPYGQWQYPHQITTIPSNNITMQGVGYPVVGVSDTGDTKVMLPGLDYLYDGNYVTEYPV